MSSKPLVIGAIAIGIAIGYAGGFLTFYNTLSDVQSVNAGAVKEELNSLKEELAKANTRVSLVTEDNEKLRSSLTQIRADNEVLQKRVDALSISLKDPSGSFAKISRGVALIHMISGPMPFEEPELSTWRLSVVNETAKLDPTIVQDVLGLVDSWVDITRFEETEPDPNSAQWNEWNLEWQKKALVFIDAHSKAISKLTDVVIREIDSLKSTL